MMKPHLEKLAMHYNGTVQFAFINANEEEVENIRIAYWAYATPRNYFIDPETRTAYLFEPFMPIFNITVDWIDNRRYLKSSPLKFMPVPYPVSDFPGLPIEYVRRDVRIFWD